MGRRSGWALVAIAVALVLAACGGSNTPAATTDSPAPTQTMIWPTYPPVTSQEAAKGVLAVVDFSHLKEGCQHPCSAPVFLEPGNKSPVLVRNWPCEYYVASGTGVCIDAEKAKKGQRDQVLVLCRKVGSTDKQDGNLADDRGTPTRNWYQIKIIEPVARTITDPMAPPLASDGTYRGYISGAWLRNANEPRGTPAFDSLSDAATGC